LDVQDVKFFNIFVFWCLILSSPALLLSRSHKEIDSHKPTFCLHKFHHFLLTHKSVCVCVCEWVGCRLLKSHPENFSSSKCKWFLYCIMEIFILWIKISLYRQSPHKRDLVHILWLLHGDSNERRLQNLILQDFLFLPRVLVFLLPIRPFLISHCYVCKLYGLPENPMIIIFEIREVLRIKKLEMMIICNVECM
jgi:hypothetical protein